MSDISKPASPVPPRVSVERQYKDVLTGALRWQGLNPRANKVIDHVVADEYLSLQEHQRLLAEAVKEARAKAFEEACEYVAECGSAATPVYQSWFLDMAEAARSAEGAK